MNYAHKKNVFSRYILSIIMMSFLIFPVGPVFATTHQNNQNPYAFNIQNATAVFDSVVGCTVTTNSISNTISKVLVKGQKFGAKTNSRFQEIFNSTTSALKGIASAVNLTGKKENTPKSLSFKIEDSDGTIIQVTDDELNDLERDLAAGKPTPTGGLNLKTSQEQLDIKGLTYGWQANAPSDLKATEDFNKFTEETGISSSTLVTDKETNKNTQEGTEEAKKTKENTAKTTAELEEQKIREQCLNGVAYALAKRQLGKTTNDILSWVNTGLGGDPFFVRDELSYLNRVADEKLRNFLGPMSLGRNSSIYPYGRGFARGAFLNRSTSFERRSMSTMNRSLPPNTTVDDWSNDFSRGGWDAWFAFTQNPYNNPLGYQLEATQELAKRQNEAQGAAIREIDQGNGFLSDKECVEWVGRNSQSFGFTDSEGSTIEVTDDEIADLERDLAEAEEADIKDSTFNITTEDGKTIEVTADEIRDIKNDLDLNKQDNNLYGPYSNGNRLRSTGNRNSDDLGDGRTCTKWEVVTPGSVISNQVNTALTSGIRQLELADSINESLSILFESMLTNLMNKGLKDLDKTVGLNMKPTNNSNFYDSLGNNLSILPGYNNNRDVLNVNKGSGFNANDFDLTIDLGDITGTIYYEGCRKSTISKKFSVPCISTKDKDLVNPIVLNECSDGIDNDGDGEIDSNDSVCNTGQQGVVKKGLITLQKDYIEAVKKAKTELPKVMPALGELDYCIPGPNPGWRDATIEEINVNIEFIRSMSVDSAGNIQTIYGKMADLDKRFSESKEGEKLAIAGQAAPVLGSVFGPIGTGVGAIVGTIFNLVAQNEQEKEAKNYYNQALLLERYAVKEKDKFEENKKNGITALIKTFTAYEKDYEALYGQNSLMRTPPSLFQKNEFYLPMANAGMELTQNMRTYARNISKARSDYDELITEANANIYRLEEIKKKVDIIVRRAKARRANDIATGKIKVDPACYGLIDLSIEEVTGGVKNDGGGGLDNDGNSGGLGGGGNSTGGGGQTINKKTGSQ